MNQIVQKIKSEYIDVWHFETPNEQFQKAYDVFEKEGTRSVREKIDFVKKEQNLWVKYSENKVAVDPYLLRLKSYDLLIEQIKETLLSNLETIIFTHCDEIKNENIVKIYKLISQIFNGQLHRATETESKYLASIGRSDQLKSSVLPIEDKFNNANSRIREIVESAIDQFNLNKRTQRREYNKKRQTEIINSVIKWVPSTAFATYLLKWILSNIFGWH